MPDASCRLYLISPPSIEIPSFSRSLEEALRGGDVASFQLRLKDTSDAGLLNAGRALLPICHAHEVAFILNDRPDLAKELGADGVHLGQDDFAEWPIAKTRALLGEKAVIGVSAHDSKHLAMEAGEQGADYVAFGAFYPTRSKSPEKLAKYGTPTPDILRWWQEFFTLPCVAIGGITPQNCSALVQAGADFIAAITAVWEHPKGPSAAVAEFNSVIAQVAQQL